MSLELCRLRKIDVPYVIYNYFPNNSEIITQDSLEVIKDYLIENFPSTILLELPVVVNDEKIIFNPELL